MIKSSMNLKDWQKVLKERFINSTPLMDMNQLIHQQIWKSNLQQFT